MSSGREALAARHPDEVAGSALLEPRHFPVLARPARAPSPQKMARFLRHTPPSPGGASGEPIAGRRLSPGQVDTFSATIARSSIATVTISWPDTRHEPPPTDHLYRSAAWLLGRHPQVAALAARVPGIVSTDPEGPDVDLDALAEAFREREASPRRGRSTATRSRRTTQRPRSGKRPGLGWAARPLAPSVSCPAPRSRGCGFSPRCPRRGCRSAWPTWLRPHRAGLRRERARRPLARAVQAARHMATVCSCSAAEIPAR